MLRARSLAVLSACALLCAGARPAAAQTTYTSRSAFLSAFRHTGQNDLDGVAIPDDPGTLSVVPGLTFGITTATLRDPSPDPDFPDRTLGPSDQGSPPNSWIVNSGGPTRLDFTAGISGFGANFFDFASRGPVTFRFFQDGFELGTVVFPLVPAGPGYAGFYGIDFGTTFNRLDIEPTGPEYYEMDDLAVGLGSTVPEPATVALVAGGVAVLAVARRRRRESRDA